MEAGFTSFSTSDAEYPFDMGDDEDMMFRMGCLPVKTALKEAAEARFDGTFVVVARGSKARIAAFSCLF